MTFLRRQSPSMFVSILALIIALGGTSYAAVVVTSANVRNESLTGADVRNGSLAGADVRNGSIRSADVGDRSLLARDFAAGQLPQGATGPQGPAGAQGAQGPAGPSASITGVAAGGHLAGTYPNPSIAVGVVNGGHVADGTIGLADLSDTAEASLTTGLTSIDSIVGLACDPPNAPSGVVRLAYAGGTGPALTLTCDAPGVNTVSLPPQVRVGTTTQGRVILSYPADAGGTTVPLVSNSPDLVVPMSVTIAEGQTEATFEATATAANPSVRVTATLNGVDVHAFVEVYA